MHPQSIIDFMLKDSGQFTVEGHYYIYSKSVYAGGKTFEEALVNWWNKYCEQDLYDDGTPVFTCDECANCYYKQLKRKEQECQQAMDNYVQLDLQRVKEYNELVDLYKVKEQECERLKETLAEIKEIAEECYYKCNSMNNCNISCKYYNNCNGEFSYLLACLNKQISECEVEDA